MFARYRAMAMNATHIAGHPTDNLLATREPAPVGEAFEHADGSIALYLDALPVSGRMLLVPIDDLRARPVRRGAAAGLDTARLRALELAAKRLLDERTESGALEMDAGEVAARAALARLLP